MMRWRTAAALLRGLCQPALRVKPAVWQESLTRTRRPDWASRRSSLNWKQVQVGQTAVQPVQRMQVGVISSHTG